MPRSRETKKAEQKQTAVTQEVMAQCIWADEYGRCARVGPGTPAGFGDSDYPAYYVCPGHRAAVNQRSTLMSLALSLWAKTVWCRTTVLPAEVRQAMRLQWSEAEPVMQAWVDRMVAEIRGTPA